MSNQDLQHALAAAEGKVHASTNPKETMHCGHVQLVSAEIMYFGSKPNDLDTRTVFQEKNLIPAVKHGCAMVSGPGQLSIITSTRFLHTQNKAKT